MKKAELKCVECNNVKGKRKCALKNGEFICSPCCAKIRNQQCSTCGYFVQSEKYLTEKEENKISNNLFENIGDNNEENFIAKIDKIIFEKVDRIFDFVERGEFKVAEEKMSILYSQHPNDHFVNYGMGVVLVSQKKYDEALTYFDNAVKIFPIFAEAWFNKALIHRMKNEILEFLTSLKNVFKYGEEGSELKDSAKKILIDFDKHVKQTMGINIDIYLKNAELYKIVFEKFMNKKYTEAILGFKKIISEMPRHYQSWGNMGLCYSYLNDKQSAITCFEKSIEINPHYEPAIQNLNTIKNLKDDENVKDLYLIDTKYGMS